VAVGTNARATQSTLDALWEELVGKAAVVEDHAAGPGAKLFLEAV
jgi:hypothetical protein